MKRFLSAVMALIMLLSVTAFAANDAFTSIEFNGKFYVYDEIGELFIEVDPEAGLVFDEEYFIFIQEPVGGLESYNVNDLKNYVFKADFEEGAKFIKSVEFVRVKEDNNGNRRLAIKVTTANVVTTDSFDIVGDILLKARRDSEIVLPNGEAVDEVILLSFDCEISCGEPVHVDYWDWEDGTPIVTFDGVDEDVLIYFGDDVTFEVDVRNQKDIYLEYSNDIIDEIYDAYPEEDLTFVLFPSSLDSFRRTGELCIPYEYEGKGAPHIYEIGKNYSLTEIDAEYDEFEEAFYLKTKTLDNYVICDNALKAVVIGSVEPSAPMNPSTGACA